MRSSRGDAVAATVRERVLLRVAVAVGGSAAAPGRGAGGSGEHLLLGGARRAARRRSGRRCITRIRSDMPITSGSSLETIRTATPVRGELAHQLVDRDAWRRRRCRGWARRAARPAARWRATGQHDLLLVAAGEELHLLVERPRAETSSELEHAGHLRARGAGRAPGEHRADHAERVVEDRLVEREALWPCGPR